MRLIDADEFPAEHVNVGYDDYGVGFDEGIQIMLDEIKDAPTVEAMPVVHGKWLHDESGANYCSECMKYAYEDEEYHMIWHTQYCPHCGAKMNDGREQDEN